jgi:TolA-binding protein
MKHLPAFIAAFIITAIVACAMLAIGANALINKNTVPVSNAPANSSSGVVPVSSTDNSTQANNATQAQIQQLQSLISQYQARDQQYQSQLNQLIQQVNQDNTQIQNLQNILVELQNRGLIFIGRDGRILIP